MVSFPVFSVVVCAWSMTRNLHGRLASVGLAQARPNHKVRDCSIIGSRYPIIDVQHCVCFEMSCMGILVSYIRNLESGFPNT